MDAHDGVTAYRRDRRRLVEQLRGRGVRDLAVLHAFDRVPRHLFVAESFRQRAYEDAALPIGFGQTISRPSVHARYLELAELEGSERVLEIGTGSGFQTALLAWLAGEVYSIERIAELGEDARERLERLGIEARLRVGDGSRGWPDAAPFDVILVAAAAARIPRPLCRQLEENGRLLVPIAAEGGQMLVRVRRRGDGWEAEEVDSARFVPLVEEAGA